MKNLWFILFLALLSIGVQAQDDQIITVRGDTLLGKVTVFSANNNSETIVLKRGKEKSKFNVYQVKSLIMNGEVYHTIRVNSVYQLGKLVKEGYLSLYYFTASEDRSRRFSSSILVKLGGAQQVVPNIGFKNRIQEFLEDCKVVEDNFKADVYTKSDLEKIIDDYNECIAVNTAKLNNQLEIGNQNLEKAEQINMLIAEIRQEGTLENTDGVVEMLNDLLEKTKNNIIIPSYLKSALREAVQSNSSYTEKINTILGEE
jgi:hypothetical protein